jgi:hypothetical protein
METVAQQLARQYPDSNRGLGATATTLTDSIVGDIRRVLLVLLSGAALLLFIALVNVVNLVLVRAERYQKHRRLLCHAMPLFSRGAASRHKAEQKDGSSQKTSTPAWT